jgi:hypothetical protein
MKKTGWIFPCEINRVLKIGRLVDGSSSIEIDEEVSPLLKRRYLGECNTHGKSCKPIKVVVELRRAK